MVAIAFLCLDTGGLNVDNNLYFLRKHVNTCRIPNCWIIINTGEKKTNGVIINIIAITVSFDWHVHKEVPQNCAP